MFEASGKCVMQTAPRPSAICEQADADVFCYECGRIFSSFQDLKNHAHRSHGFVSDARKYAVDDQCLACLTVFGNRLALVQYLSNRHHCLDTLRAVYNPLDPVRVKLLDVQALALAKQKRPVAPALRLMGPRIDPSMCRVPRNL